MFDLTDGNPEAAPIVGRNAALEAVRASVRDAATVHRSHSPEFDGDKARVVWAVQERLVWNDGTSSRLMATIKIAGFATKVAGG